MAVLNFTAPLVAHLKPEAKARYVHDVTGLALRIGSIAHGGKKSWSVRYRIGKRMRRLTIGRFPTLSLADARAAVRDARKEVAKGIDPAETKIVARTADTVAEFYENTFLEKHAKKNKSWKDMDACARKDVLPAWKHRAMTSITRRDVRELLETVAARAPIVANRVRSLLHKMFEVAIARDVVENNPVHGVEKPGKEQSRDRVLSQDEIRQFWAATEKLSPEMAAMWKLRLLTGQRGGEVIDMGWSELDLKDGWWTIPADRSKNKLAHRVPLSAPVLTMLKDLRAAEDERLARPRKKELKAQPYVLREARGKRQQREAAETFKIPNFRGHDLRRTAATLMASTGTTRFVISKILNHAESGVTAVYDRASYDTEKKIALDAWARTLTSIIEDKQEGPAVLPFSRA